MFDPMGILVARHARVRKSPYEQQDCGRHEIDPLEKVAARRATAK